MSRTILVIGGASSGKSSFALSLSMGRKLFIATAEPIDDEMERKIERHRMERKNDGWELLEEPLRIGERLGQMGDFDTILLDSVTIWISNMLAKDMDEDAILNQVRGVFDKIRKLCKKGIFVTDEVGMGIVPENPLSRFYREILGRVNMLLAQLCDEVYFVVAGIPLKLK